MIRLASVLFSIIGTTLAGSGVIAVLVMGLSTPAAIITAAAMGTLLALPVSWMVAHRITRLTAA